MPAEVLDSWAVMGWLQGEAPVRGVVRRILKQAEAGKLDLAMSWINVGEVFYLLSKRHGNTEAERFLSKVPSMPLQAVLPDEGTIIEAARWKSQYRIAYADAFAVETARRLQARLITGDPELRPLEVAGVIKLHWVGRVQ